LYSGSGPIVVDASSFVQVSVNTGGTLGPVTGARIVRTRGANNTLSFQSIRAGAIEATFTGVVRITAGGGNTGTGIVNSISLTGNGRLDLHDNGVIFDSSGASPASSIRTLLSAGRAGGAWNGNNGIGSSLALDANRRAVGYAEATAINSPTFFLVRQSTRRAS